MNSRSCIIFFVGLFVLYFSSTSFATTATVEDQEPKYKYIVGAPPPSAREKAPEPSKDLLKTDLTASVTQGVDMNPLLDSTHKADNYTQEIVDLHFGYSLPENKLGPSDIRFGANALNVNYYNITDVNIFDGIADVYLDQDICKNLTASAGYIFESMWYPNNRDGNYIGNSFIISLKHKITDRVYQRGTYRTEYRYYFDRKARLGNGNLSSDLRADSRNTFKHEIGVYVGSKVKLRIINDFYINGSNYQFLDYYDYWAYRTGGSLTAILTKKLYGTTGFYYQRRSYDSRELSVSQAFQRDNLYMATASLIYDITKNLSAFLNYSHSENHTNEPLERYVDTLYSGGLSYAF